MAGDSLSKNQKVPRTTVVGVGASAGGVTALSNLLETLPADLGAALVVIVHLDPEARSQLPHILEAHSHIPVMQVTDTLPLEANRVYVIPPDRELEISDNEISAMPFAEPRGRRTPIDSFFRSLAHDHGDGFAIILTGGGSDGAVGIKAVKLAASSWSRIPPRPSIPRCPRPPSPPRWRILCCPSGNWGSGWPN